MEDERIEVVQTSITKSKRSRVQVACQRCKLRKQKCNGVQPVCSTCARLHLECRYVMPLQPKPQETRVYIKALEGRVAELEMYLTKTGHADVDFDHLDQVETRVDDDSPAGYSLLTTVRDMSLNTSGSFVGGSSSITLARILESVIGNSVKDQLATQITAWEGFETQTPGSTSPDLRESSFSATSHTPSILSMHPNVGDRLLQAYLGHVSINYPVIHSIYIQSLHSRRDVLDDPYEESILHLVYALAGQFLESTNSRSRESEHCEWRHHFEAAVDNCNLIVKLGDTRTVTYLLLLVQHCLRVPKDPAPWTLVGIAMRLCIELGLHRRKRQVFPTLKSELEKRLFWSCYYTDRDLSIALGRPPSISDHDIDVELPLDMDEDIEDETALKRSNVTNKPSNPPTTMTCFIHIIRLKRIESGIQRNLYRVDDSINSNRIAETERFLQNLTVWRENIPHHSREIHGDPRTDTYMVSYYKSVRLLLQPQLYEAVINERHLELCIEACSGICERYRRLHDHLPVAFLTLSLQTIFLAGLTLIYCLWLSPSSTAIKYMSSMSDCSILLYVMTEKWPKIRRYRDAFEAIKRSVLSLIAEDKHKPRKALPEIATDVRTTLRELDSDMHENMSRNDLEHMIGDMTGESIWNDQSANVDMTFQQDEVNMSTNYWTNPVEGTFTSTGWQGYGPI